MDTVAHVGVAGEAVYVGTIAGGGNQPRIAQISIDSNVQPAWATKCEVSCSSAAEGCQPSALWVAQRADINQWLQLNLSNPLHVVGIEVSSNHNGSKGALGVGYCVTQLNIRKKDADNTWHNVVLRSTGGSTPIFPLGAQGATIMFETGSTVSALRICPEVWAGGGIGMKVVLLVEVIVGPCNIGFAFDTNNQGIKCHPDNRELFVFDNTTVKEGGWQHFGICHQLHGGREWKSMHVPRPEIIMQERCDSL